MSQPGRRRHYALDRHGFPIIRTLEVLRKRRFSDLVSAAKALQTSARDLRNWELGRVEPREKTCAKLESVFGRPWAALRRMAPRFGIPKGEQQ